METTQLMQQNGEALTCDDNHKSLTNANDGFDVQNGVPNSNGDCETNKMLNKSENIELSTSRTDVKCCNGFFAQRNAAGKQKQKNKIKESQSNGTSNGKCYFNSFKEKLSNGKHTQLIEENVSDKKPTKPLVFDDRDPFKVNSNVKFEYLNVFAEPNSGTYSFNPTWSFTSRMYFSLKLYIYRLFAILIGVPSAFLCAIIFAIFSVIQIWLITPFLRLFKAFFSIIRDIWSTIIDTVFGPILQTIAVAFRSNYSSRCPSSASSKSIYNEEVNVV